MIVWEQFFQVANTVIVEDVENIAGLLDDSLDIAIILKLNKLVDVVELLAHTR